MSYIEDAPALGEIFLTAQSLLGARVSIRKKCVAKLQMQSAS
jgi:hypothetical protein